MDDLSTITIAVLTMVISILGGGLLAVLLYELNNIRDDTSKILRVLENIKTVLEEIKNSPK
jgi:hypothetical protein